MERLKHQTHFLLKAATFILGLNLVLSALYQPALALLRPALSAFTLPRALAQNPTATVVQLNPGILSIVYSPADFVMSPVNISSPIEQYYSYYNNPRVLDQDQNPATRDGTGIRVQDGRFKGGFELQAQVDSDYASGNNKIPRSNLGIRTGVGAPSEINETVTNNTPATSAPLDKTTSYTNFQQPLVLLDGGTANCNEGRVGIYTVYPSFRLLVPNDTAAGTYTTSITYTLLENPAC